MPGNKLVELYYLVKDQMFIETPYPIASQCAHCRGHCYSLLDKLNVFVFVFCFLLGLLGTDLHGVHRHSELPSGRTGGKPLHMLGSSGWRFPGQTLL